VVIAFTAVTCHTASASTACRLLFAFPRDGFGPHCLSTVDSSSTPPRAVALVFEHVGQYSLQWDAIRSIAARLA
jgi:amino acid permease